MSETIKAGRRGQIGYTLNTLIKGIVLLIVGALVAIVIYQYMYKGHAVPLLDRIGCYISSTAVGEGGKSCGDLGVSGDMISKGAEW